MRTRGGLTTEQVTSIYAGTFQGLVLGSVEGGRGDSSTFVWLCGFVKLQMEDNAAAIGYIHCLFASQILRAPPKLEGLKINDHRRVSKWGLCGGQGELSWRWMGISRKSSPALCWFHRGSTSFALGGRADLANPNTFSVEAAGSRSPVAITGCHILGHLGRVEVYVARGSSDWEMQYQGADIWGYPSCYIIMAEDHTWEDRACVYQPTSLPLLMKHTCHCQTSIPRSQQS